MRINNLVVLGLILTIVSCSSEHNNTSNVDAETVTELNEETASLKIIISSEFTTDTNEHYRGLEIKDGLAYIAGSLGGTYTVDLSSSKLTKIFMAEGRHLRDIDILPNGDIIALAITEPAQILLKEADADSFEVIFQGEEGVFLDGIDFTNSGGSGIAFGDPINGFPYILSSNDGGRNWFRLAKSYFKNIDSTYAGFAASGSSVVYFDDGTTLVGLGNETAKVIRSEFYTTEQWTQFDVPYHQEPNGSGIYSFAFKNELEGVAVGGHWQNVTCDSSKVYTSDGGLTWQLASGVHEYRSCVTYFKDDIYISTGTSGTDISYDGGKSWQMLDTIGYNAIAFQEDGVGIGVGSYGKISIIHLK